MITAVITLVATLSGAIVTGAIQHVSQRAARRADQAVARRAETLAAVTELAVALDDHRRAMWVREDLRLRGEDWSEARAESHRTRSAITAPLLRVQLLAPSLGTVAQAAAKKCYGLRGAVDNDDLTGLRERAIEARDELTSAAGRTLATV